MIINIGDTIRQQNGREGVITNIGIATTPTDIAAESENSLSAKTYDTDLNYTGAVTFGDNWCYFMQIKDVVKKNEYGPAKLIINQIKLINSKSEFLVDNRSFLKVNGVEYKGTKSGRVIESYLYGNVYGKATSR